MFKDCLSLLLYIFTKLLRKKFRLALNYNQLTIETKLVSLVSQTHPLRTNILKRLKPNEKLPLIEIKIFTKQSIYKKKSRKQYKHNIRCEKRAHLLL